MTETRHAADRPERLGEAAGLPPTPRLRRRLMKGAQGQAAQLSVRFIVQVGTVSVLAGTWGIHLFGEWLILAAVPLYLAASDIGLLAAAVNAMVLKVAAGDREGALAVFRAVTAVVLVLFGIVALALTGFAVVAPLTAWLNLKTIGEGAAGLILVTLGLNTLAAFYAQVLYGGFASVGHYGEGALVNAGIALAEFGALITVVLAGGPPALAAAAMLGTRLVGTVVMYVLMRRRAPWLRFGRIAGKRAVLRPLLTPALASAAFPAGFALNVQGMVILIGAVAGPASAAVFSIMRTMTRIIGQVMVTVFAVIAPELSRAFATDNVSALRTLHRHGCQGVFWLTVAVTTVLALFGGSILRAWTSGEVNPHGILLYLFLAVAALNSLWVTSFAVMFASNRHQRLGAYFIAVSALGIPLAYVGLELWGLNGAAAVLVGLEAFMFVTTLRQTLPATGDTLSAWLGAVVRPPPVRALPALLRPGSAAREESSP